MAEVVIFYVFSAVTLFGALGVILHPNPIICALHLVATMCGIAGLFFGLNAPFIAAVQLMVYAGAVMVLFLFVVMIFNLKQEGKHIFSPGQFTNGLKVLFGGMFAGLLLSSILFKINNFGYLTPDKAAPQFEVKNIAKVMFTDYVFSFEILGLLLLVIPIGTVALSRVRGGTHAK
ncbi:MAG: NADH-quinone oxidoreductase subunit J [Bdellovibrionales bacterium]|nr:NADH-quinone oxidoreductase subunit J [Bdellovibrionales bacterium]